MNLNRRATVFVFKYVAVAGSGDRRRWWRAAARVGVAAALLAALALRIGGAAFARGIGSLTLPVLCAAVALTALSTYCAAWRWRAVARRLGAPLPVGRSVAAYYRSQFLNSVLPSGVAGDAHRAVAHGREVDDVARAARAVVWERTAGQLVQAVITIGLLAFMPSPGRRVVPLLLIVLAGGVVAGWYVSRGRARRSSWRARVAGVVRSDLREVMCGPVWPVLVLASSVVVASHIALFVLVAHSVDPAASVRALVPLTAIILIATSVPLSVAGWGLREGAAAWAFAAAGLGAPAGVGASAAYGVASLIAVLPGVFVLGVELLHRGKRSQQRRGRPASPLRRGVAMGG